MTGLVKAYLADKAIETLHAGLFKANVIAQCLQELGETTVQQRRSKSCGLPRVSREPYLANQYQSLPGVFGQL